MTIETQTAGSIAYAEDWTMDNVIVRTQDGKPVQLKNCSRVELPRFERLAEETVRQDSGKESAS
ncbi:hypothetical protein O9H85_19025 [Paenibacillus filicis]|uniref:Uncharacterized protein n=1 Tax=Paenibacillus gyeongsangnamensis TaxID=3388067 RepID=A0ABT4QCC3_9BACL|nr:hypothetical protein [Paenibacillus filicis]MCZ8514475.1 hypothetical protein [Paenibacillus filicis]